jgi:hypothetical protein
VVVAVDERCRSLAEVCGIPCVAWSRSGPLAAFVDRLEVALASYDRARVARATDGQKAEMSKFLRACGLLAEDGASPSRDVAWPRDALALQRPAWLTCYAVAATKAFPAVGTAALRMVNRFRTGGPGRG